MTDREKFEVWFTEYTGYPVNEHPSANVVEMMRQAWQAALASQQPADDGWVEWAGGECPVRADAIVDVKWSGGNQSDFGKAYYWSWEHYDYEDNIIAYRVVKP